MSSKSLKVGSDKVNSLIDRTIRICNENRLYRGGAATKRRAQIEKELDDLFEEE